MTEAEKQTRLLASIALSLSTFTQLFCLTCDNDKVSPEQVCEIINNASEKVFALLFNSNEQQS